MKFIETFLSFADASLLISDEEILVESRISRMFFAGISSAGALFATHPFDVIKLNLQVKHMTIGEIINYHYIKDKCLTGIYKGVASSMIRSMVYCNIRFELYEMARRQNLLSSFYRKVTVASLAGGIGGFFVTPISKVHVRTQNDDMLAPDERRYYKGLFHGLSRIYNEEGLRMMFFGSLVSALRGMMSTIGQIALYEEVKQLLLKHPEYFGDGLQMYLASSVTAGFAATLLQQPFEVVSIKLMSAPLHKYKTTWDVVTETARHNGVAGFYKGLVPGFMRIVPQTVVTYMILENLRINFGLLSKSGKKGDVIEIFSIDNESVSDQLEGNCKKLVIAQEEDEKRKAKVKSVVTQKEFSQENTERQK